MTALPPFKVEIDADPNVSALFVLDTSVLDSGTRLLAADARFVAVPADDVLAVDIKRGRSRDDQANDVGTATITFDAWSGNYDPDNTGGTYRYNGEALLRQGMQTRVSATIGGVDHVLFTGALESSAAGFDREPTMTWTCVDILARLGHAAFPPSAEFERAGDTSEQRIDWLLRYDNAYENRVVTPSGRTLVGTQGGGTVLSNLEDVARAEWGRVYADRNNVLTITHHADEYAKMTVLTISDSAADGGTDTYVDIYADLYPGLAVLDPESLSVEPGLTLVANQAILTRTDMTVEVDSEGNSTSTSTEVRFTGEDALSIERYGVRSQSATILLADDGDAQELADYLATHRAVPSPWLSAVTSSLAGGSDTVMASAADLDLGDWIVVQRTTADGRVLDWRVSAEGIDHSITVDKWLLTVATAPLDLASLYGSAGWMTLDVSTLDGADALAAY